MCSSTRFASSGGAVGSSTLSAYSAPAAAAAAHAAAGVGDSACSRRSASVNVDELGGRLQRPERQLQRARLRHRLQAPCGTRETWRSELKRGLSASPSRLWLLSDV